MKLPSLPTTAARALLLAAALAAPACGTSGTSYHSDVDYIVLDGATPGRHGPRTHRPHLGATDPHHHEAQDASLHGPWSGVLAERCRAVEPLMRVAAMERGVDVGLIAGIIRTESTFRPDARSRRGATGLMQVMPSVAKSLRCGDLTDPSSNIACGLTVLERFMARYDNQLMYGLSAYNAGYRAPNEARENGTIPSNMSYVEAVLGHRATYLRHGCGE